jgi:hypothetical protein
MNQKENNLCKCGHRQQVHFGACSVSGIMSLAGDCHCEKYVSDNLKYLEMLYEEKSNKN